jgi:hypothetical protein
MVAFKIVRLDISGIEHQLERIGNLLEQLLIQGNLDDYVSPEPAALFYSDEEEEILEHLIKKANREK